MYKVLIKGVEIFGLLFVAGMLVSHIVPWMDGSLPLEYGYEFFINTLKASFLLSLVVAIPLTLIFLVIPYLRGNRKE